MPDKGMGFQKYRSWVFDCDGVLLDSNRVKSDAFYQTALKFGEEPAARFREYHQQNGGISRFKKFEYFFSKILLKSEFGTDLKSALNRYGEICQDGLIACKTAPGLAPFLSKIRQTEISISVASGGMQEELREIFLKRNLEQYFDGIFGSPDDKDKILSREINQKTIQFPAIFLGDSRYDYEVATRHGLDFIFVSGWTEFSDWKSYFKGKDIPIVTHVTDIDCS